MIQVTDLTKYYGDFPAVKNLSFEFEGSHVYGFLGPNGAGKSTTMNMITGCLSPSSGRILIDGHDLLEEPEAAKRQIGYLPEQPPLYLNETPLEYLTFVGEAKGLRGKALREGILDVLTRTGLLERCDQLIRTLSKGFKQRVGIAQALLGDPELIILDEPTVGLDPIQIIEIRDLIRTLGESHTVIFSSHILSEVQAICEKVLILSKGQLVAFDTPENLELLINQSGGILLSAEGPYDMAHTLLSSMELPEGWELKDNGDGTLSASVPAAPGELRALSEKLFFAFAGARIPLYELRSHRASLEEVFIDLTENTPEETGEAFPLDSGELPEESGSGEESEVTEE